MALGAIANEGKSVVFEVVLDLGQRPVRALVDGLLGASKIKSLDSPGGLKDVRH